MKHVDVIVIGAGPAGVGAALAAKSCGASVALIDEGRSAGGHLAWSIATQHGRVGDLVDSRGHDIAHWFAEQVKVSDIDIALGAVAWGLFGDLTVGVTDDQRSARYRAKSIVVATGSTDIVEPFQGWETAGVMTAGAALRMLHIQRVLPGRQVVVVGGGDVASEVEEAFRVAGADSTTRVERPSDIVAGGDGEVAWVIAQGRERPADCVVIALGRQPDPELVLQVGSDVGYSRLDDCFVPRRSRYLETSVRGVFAAGDCAGICSAAEAFAEGTLAGLAAARSERALDAAIALDELRCDGRQRQVEELLIPEAPDVAGVEGAR